MTSKTTNVIVQTHRATLIVAGLLFLVVLALWLPFGFIIPHHEPWWLHSQYELGLNPTVSLTGIRSLHYVVPWLAYKLSPDSFMGYHFLMILGFWAKGFLLYLIVRKLFPQTIEIAIAAGVLLIIFPADTAIFIMQATLHHIGLSLLLLSVYLFLEFRENRKLFLFVAMVFCQWASISVYEAGLPLMFMILFVAWWLDRRLTRRVVLLSVQWIIVPIFWTVIIIGVFLKPAAEQGYIGQVSQNSLGNNNLFSTLPSNIWQLYPNHFLIPWRDTINSLALANPTFIVVACFTAISVAIILFLLGRKTAPTKLQIRSIRRELIGLVITGLVMVTVGFAMYLPTDLQTSTVRTYFYTAIGASICLTSLSCLISQIFKKNLQNIVFVFFIALLVFTAMINDLEQHNVLAQHSTELKRFLSNIVSTIPSVENGVYLYLVGDETVEPHDVSLSEANEGNVLAYLYSDYTLRAASGYFNKGCLHTIVESSDQYATCEPGPNGVIATDPNGTIIIPYSQIVALQFDENGNTTLLEQFPSELIDQDATTSYHPELLIKHDSQYPLHARTVLGM